MKIGSRYITGSRETNVCWGTNPHTLVHIFPKKVVPDGTLVRVYCAGPAGEPPPRYVYKAASVDRVVMRKENRNPGDSEFVVFAVPNSFILFKEIHDDTGIEG